MPALFEPTNVAQWFPDKDAFKQEADKMTAKQTAVQTALNQLQATIPAGNGNNTGPQQDPTVKVAGDRVVFEGHGEGTAFGSGADQSIQIEGLDKLVADGGMAIGEKLTFVFTNKEEARSNIHTANLIQNGANAGQHSFLSLEDTRSKALDVDKIDVIDVTGKWEASAAIEKINNALAKVSAQRSRLGASQNRLEHTINQLSNTSENLTASESRIRDADTAKEVMGFTKTKLLAQSQQAMMAQSKQKASQVLALLA